MSDFATVLLFLAPPIWFPVVRMLIALAPSFRAPKAAVWCYAISFVWAFGWCLFQWVIHVPSGVGFGLALVTAWPVLLAALVFDAVAIFRKKPRSSGQFHVMRPAQGQRDA
jgi:hypothetical protein